MSTRAYNATDRSDLSIYKMYFPEIEPVTTEKLINYLCYTLVTTIGVEPIGIHRVGEAIEFAVNTTPQDEINLRHFYIHHNGIDIYLIKDDEDILIVNSCGYDFRESVSEISTTIIAKAKIVNYYRQKRKYNGRYTESGTLTFWVKDIQTPLDHKVDKRRRCYFNDEQHFNLLKTPSEATHDLFTDEETETMGEEEALEGNAGISAVITPDDAGEVTEVAAESEDEPPVKRRACSPIPLKPDLAPGENDGESTRPAGTESVTVPPPNIFLNELEGLAYNTPLPFTPDISPRTSSATTHDLSIDTDIEPMVEEGPPAVNTDIPAVVPPTEAAEVPEAAVEPAEELPSLGTLNPEPAPEDAGGELGRSENTSGGTVSPNTMALTDDQIRQNIILLALKDDIYYRNITSMDEKQQYIYNKYAALAATPLIPTPIGTATPTRVDTPSPPPEPQPKLSHDVYQKFREYMQDVKH